MARTRLSTEHRPIIALRLLVGLRFQVLFHSPHRGTFHLSLTVLVHYRSPDVFSLGEWTPQLPAGLACPAVLRYQASGLHIFAYGTVTRSGWLSHTILLTCSPLCGLALQPPCACTRVWAAPFSLATTQGMLSFPLGTEMFQFPRFPPTAYVFNGQCWRCAPAGFPIRISSDLRLFTAPRGFSQ